MSPAILALVMQFCVDVNPIGRRADCFKAVMECGIANRTPRQFVDEKYETLVFAECMLKRTKKEE